MSAFRWCCSVPCRLCSYLPTLTTTYGFFTQSPPTKLHSDAAFEVTFLIMLSETCFFLCGREERDGIYVKPRKHVSSWRVGGAPEGRKRTPLMVFVGGWFPDSPRRDGASVVFPLSLGSLPDTSVGWQRREDGAV